MNDLLKNFWYAEDNATPMTLEEIKTQEERLGFNLPQFLKDIYSLSNGGRTTYICYPTATGKISLFQNGTLLPMNEWESLNEFAADFDLDDEETLKAAAKLSHAVVISRCGFDYFVVLAPANDGKECWIGQLDVTDDEPQIRQVCKGSDLSKLTQV